MFRITAETCRSFTLPEILIMAAMNDVESHLDSESLLHDATVTEDANI